MSIRPLEHTSDSANIAYYREKGVDTLKPYVWVDVLFSFPYRRNEAGHIEIDPDRKPYHAITVHKTGEGVLCNFKVERKERGPLTARVVTRLVREQLA